MRIRSVLQVMLQWNVDLTSKQKLVNGSRSGIGVNSGEIEGCGSQGGGDWFPADQRVLEGTPHQGQGQCKFDG